MIECMVWVENLNYTEEMYGLSKISKLYRLNVD